MPGPDLRRQSGPHIFVVDLDAPTLDDDDRHHLTKALRLRDGDPLTLSDGAGRWCTARFGDTIEPTGAIVETLPPASRLGIACALTKGSKPELVVQKATEIGIDHVVLFGGDHSVPVWNPAKRDRALERLARIAREAAMQSRQVRIPEIAFHADLAAVAAAVPDDVGLARADFGGAEIDASIHLVAVGPEGGWSDHEAAEVTATVDLGPSVLRAETAALVAAAKLIACRHLASSG